MSSNARKSSASKIKLDTYDDLFGNDTAENSSLEQIISVPLTFHDMSRKPLSASMPESRLQQSIQGIRQSCESWTDL
ncbi:MAG: hypothetical protein J6A75_11315 [Lachnospiraceae bacterium]|nr:hypothetical protein [Lachnospiraceae bacterium]